jgi:hypothetical protein
MISARDYKERNDSVMAQILLSSSNVRSVSLINARGTLKGFKMREDISLLLSPKQMGELALQLNSLIKSMFNFSHRLGFLHYMYLDFDDVHALVYQLADRNVLMITVEKMENDVPRLAKFVEKLLVKKEMTFVR